MTFTTTKSAVDHFISQGRLQPGEEGFWKVWGVNATHIRSHDLIATLVNGEVKYDLIMDTFKAKSAPIRQGLINAEAEILTIGMAHPVIILRWGTKNTLA